LGYIGNGNTAFLNNFVGSIVGKTMENDDKILRKFTERTLVSFLSYIVLGRYGSAAFSGYEIIKYIQQEFGVLPSAGTVYATLYSMERKQLITGQFSEGNKRVYKVTDKGQHLFKVITSDGYHRSLLNRIFRNFD
jgi:DNA-binding PadR family transcriptional regulator